MKKDIYPKYLYHADRGSIMVSNKKEEKQLGWGWCDSPVLALNRKLTFFEKIRLFLIRFLQGGK